MTNRYLEGNFGPITTEYTETNLSVTGQVPEFLDGRYLRNGPNPIGEIDPQAYHWFLGAGMVHGVHLRDGAAQWYRNRWVRSPAVASQLSELPRKAHPSAPFPHLSANTNVIGHAGKTIALVEGGLGCSELTDELATIGGYDFDGTLRGGYTAHPKRDPLTGELHAVSHYVGWHNKFQYSVIDAQGHARRVVDIEVDGKPFMHDMSITEKHVIFYDLPLVFDTRQFTDSIRFIPRPMRHATALVASAFLARFPVPDPVFRPLRSLLRSDGALPYRWDPEHPARIGVMPREGGNADVRWYEVEPCYVFHPLNAFDTEAGVALDVVRHPSMLKTDLSGADEGHATLDRWNVDFASGKVREERLDDRPQEFPRVDERLVGRPYRYGYTPLMVSGARAASGILKHDLDKGTSQLRDFGKGAEVGEFVFEPRHADAAEDDGVLMGFVYDKASDLSDLVIIDAGTLEDVARVHLPTRVPHGFHGNWAPSTEESS